MKKVTQIRQNPALLPKKKKVAAYCRVSSNAERPQHSLATQINYFTQLIENNPQWELAGIYSDFGISGTGTQKRIRFLKMLEDCDKGKIDLILTKSIQRFARNTVDLLETVRSLKQKGIEVFFEKENLSTLSGDGELMISILASIAQEESHGISQNLSWAVEKEFEKGRPHSGRDFLGYHWNGEKFEIVEEQAKIVRYIFDELLKKKPAAQVARELNEKGWLGVRGLPWSGNTVRSVSKNIHYTGVLLLGQYYYESPITHKQVKNRGERAMYYVEDAHEAIISKEQFDAVQEEFDRRREMGSRWHDGFYSFSRKLVCPYCGSNYRRGKTGNYAIWSCGNKYGKAACPNAVTLDEEALINTCAEVLDPERFRQEVESIRIYSKDKLEFHFYDGRIRTVRYKGIYRKAYSEDRKREQSQRCRNRDHVKRSQRESCFTRTIKCSRCGGNYRSFVRKYLDGTSERIWTCSHMGVPKIKNSDLERLSSEVLKTDEFDPAEFDHQVKAVHVNGSELEFEMRNGQNIIKEYRMEAKKPCRR